MDKVIAFTKRYGYVAYEEAARMFVLGLFMVFAKAYLWYAIILLSGVAFGLCHKRFGWLAVLGSCAGGILFGWLFAIAVPFPFNILVIVGLHQVWALFGDKYI